jgi:hypothetical protein
VRVIVAPLFIIIGLVISINIINLFGDSLGTYSNSEKMLKKAKLTQQDLIRGEQYGKNYHDIGEFDESFTSVFKKAPEAIITGLFRPFLWEANNPVMLISGIENFLFLISTLYLGLHIGPFRLVRLITKDPLLFFSFTFALIFAFSVGLSTANYGALVRYRIPALPLFINGLILIFHFYKEERKNKL